MITIFLPFKQTPVPKPKLNGSLSLLKGLLNLNRPVLCRFVETCGNTADMFSTKKYVALCPCLYPLESSRKYLYVLFIFTIILSLYQPAEKCMHIVGLIFPTMTTKTTDISSSDLSFFCAVREHLGVMPGVLIFSSVPNLPMPDEVRTVDQPGCPHCTHWPCWQHLWENPHALSHWLWGTLSRLYSI